MLPDNYDLWERYDSERENELNKRPICDECGEHIQEEYCYHINGKHICEHCIKDSKVSVESF